MGFRPHVSFLSNKSAERQGRGPEDVLAAWERVSTLRVEREAVLIPWGTGERASGRRRPGGELLGVVRRWGRHAEDGRHERNDKKDRRVPVWTGRMREESADNEVGSVEGGISATRSG